MSILHTVSRSAYTDNSLRRCLSLALPASAIVLLEDAVYAARTNTDSIEQLKQRPANICVFVLKADLEARGISDDELQADIETIDYDMFVRLACQYDKVQAWF